jgi:hypothetical protein
VAEDWFCVTPWFIVEDELTSVEDWLAVTALLVVWLPDVLPGCVFTLTPGLMFAPALTSLFAIPTLAPTPTLGLTFVEVPPLDAESDEGACAMVVEDCVVDAPCDMFEVEPISVELWLADTLL